MAEYQRQLKQDTFTTTGNGATLNVINQPIKYFAIQVKGTVAAPTGWSIVLEGSLDGIAFSTILTHSTATGDGVILWGGSNAYPVLYFRSRVVSLTLGSATDVVVSLLGYE